MKKYKFNILLLPIIFLMLLCFVLIFYTPMWGDELNWHYENTQFISMEKILDPYSFYQSAYTPLPYLLGNIVYQISSTIYALRILNFFVFVLIAYFVYKIAKHLELNPLLLVLIVISNPYILRSSFVYYMSNYGLLFSIMGIYYHFFSTFKYNKLIANLSFGSAILCQQWMVVVVAAVILYEISLFIKNELTSKELIKSILFKVIFLLPALLLFYQWRGLTHPHFHSYEVKTSFEHLNGVLANIGFAGMFIVIFNIKKFFKPSYLSLVFFLPAIWLTMPLHSNDLGRGVITGVAAQLSTQISKAAFIPYKINMLVFVVFGTLLLILILSKYDFEFFKFIILGFILAYSSSALLGASHIFVCLPFIFLYFAKELKEHRLLQILLTTQLYCISIMYVIYYSFFIVNEMAM